MTSTTLVAVNPTLKRLRGVLTNLSEFIVKNGDDRQRRMHRVLSIVIDEVSEEMAEMPETLLAEYLVWMGRVIMWAGTGDMSVLPPPLLGFACDIEGIDIHDLFKVDENESLPERAEIEA